MVIEQNELKKVSLLTQNDQLRTVVRALGRISNKGIFKTKCSGILTSEEIFIIPSHCLSSHIRITKLRVHFSNNNNRKDSYKVDSVIKKNNQLAMLKLKDRPGKKRGYISLSKRQFTDADMIHIEHDRKDDHLHYTEINCNPILINEKFGLVHTCDATEIGGAILSRDLKLLGLNIGVTIGQKVYNRATSLEQTNKFIND